jgi:signal transduction histidine kinase
MLDVFGASSAQFEQGRVLGREEERNRITKAFHDEVSSSIVAALFMIETAKTELEQAGLPQADVVAKASDILVETTKKIADALSPGADARSES